MSRPKTTAGARESSRKAPRRTSGNDAGLGQLRRKFGLSRRVLARLTGFSERALADWESGKPMTEPGARRIPEMERFQQRLAEVVQPEIIPTWLEAPNAAFDGLKPLEVIERGEIDRLWKMIFYLESGVAS